MSQPYFTRAERLSAEAYIDSVYWSKHGTVAEAEIELTKDARTVAPVDLWESDAYLCHIAERRADWMLDAIAELGEPVTLAWLNRIIGKLEATPFLDKLDDPDHLQGCINRVCCQHYWRRQLRRAQVQKREAQEQAAGRVSIRAGQPYVTDFTVSRYTERQQANKKMLEATEIESAEGEIMNLWEAVEASTSNKSHRRSELMTRIRGAEEWATAAGMVGIFTTNTLPSRFHATSHASGGMNPNFDGSTPLDGQAWLCKTWAKARAQIKRLKIKTFGFRVAEPHHDGCPHWHMLLWVDAGQVQTLTDLMRAHWLNDSGNEPGAQQYRFKAVAIDAAKGGAIAYVAKYIAKNIDDAGAIGADGHTDQIEGADVPVNGGSARRVTAWASAWGIRQFQAIGQPPVTVWRELRRIDAAMIAGASPALQEAHAAVHKTDSARACWKKYVGAQGGAMTGRDYLLRLETEPEKQTGRYGPVILARPVGVWDTSRPGETCTSNRSRWKPRGTWAPHERSHARRGVFGEAGDLYLAFVSPWTRFNNCTQTERQHERKPHYSAGQPSPASLGQRPRTHQTDGRGIREAYPGRPGSPGHGN